MIDSRRKLYLPESKASPALVISGPASVGLTGGRWLTTAFGIDEDEDDDVVSMLEAGRVFPAARRSAWPIVDPPSNFQIIKCLIRWKSALPVVILGFGEMEMEVGEEEEDERQSLREWGARGGLVMDTRHGFNYLSYSPTQNRARSISSSFSG